MSKRFVIVLVVILLGFLGIFFSGRKKAAAPSNSSSSSTTTNHIMGNGKKGITLVEYGDYQCPACGAYYPIIKTLVEKYKDDIYFQFRNFPLVSIHQNAFASARAAEAADKQGKFWEMHDLLYEQQSNWSTNSSPNALFDQYAQQIGLNVAKFEEDFKSVEINNLITADLKAAQTLGADSTPTFVLDGKIIDNNPQSQDAFNKLIEKEIAAKTQK